MFKRICITLACIACAAQSAKLTLPVIDSHLIADRDLYKFSALVLGLRPWMTAFYFVELWSLLFRRGRRLRRMRFEGRRRLNAWSIRLGVLIAAMQAFGIGYAASVQSEQATIPFLSIHGAPFFLFWIATLTAGAIVYFILAQVISRWGVGNGICMLLLGPLVWALMTDIYHASSLNPIFINGLEPLVWICSIGILVRFFAHRPRVEFLGADGSSVAVSVPAFPTGAVPLTLGTDIIALVAFMTSMWAADIPVSSLLEPERATDWSTALMVSVMCMLTFHFFSSRKRLICNLPPGAVDESSGSPLRRQTLETIVAFAGIGILFWFGAWHWNFRFSEILGLVSIVLVIAFGFDLIEEFRFRMKYDDQVESIMEFDNVYGASFLSAALTNAGIDSSIRAFHYRSLFFFFQPIVKMELLVPTESALMARNLVQSIDLKVV